MPPASAAGESSFRDADDEESEEERSGDGRRVSKCDVHSSVKARRPSNSPVKKKKKKKEKKKHSVTLL